MQSLVEVEEVHQVGMWYYMVGEGLLKIKKYLFEILH